MTPTVRAYLDRDLDLDQLKAWFAGAKGPLLALAAEWDVSKLATLIELGLIEMRDSGLSQRQFRKLLKQEMDAALHLVVEGNPEVTFSESVTTEQSRVIDSSPRQASSVFQETLAEIRA